jgi:hypothetical protein
MLLEQNKMLSSQHFKRILTPRQQINVDKKLQTTCQHNYKIEPSADWKYSIVKTNKINPCDGCTKTYPILFTNPDYENDVSYIMNNCSCNEYVGLMNRYLKKTKNKVHYNHDIVENILTDLSTLLKQHFKGPITVQEFLDTKSGKLARRYDAAARSINNNGFNIFKDNKVKAFIKNEIYDEEKAPRMIMGRDPRFNIAYGMYTHPLEEAMMKLPQISKGKNFVERGKQFADLIFGKNILEGDCSKYESTQRHELLRHIELGLWRRLLNDEDFQNVYNLFMAKMRKKGTTYNNLEFEFWYCRGSGDMDTGLFNTLIMYVACRYFEIVNQTGSGNFICDGDDNLISVPQGIKPIDTFKEFGLDAKLILRNDYHDAEYCSGKFIQLTPGNFMYIQNLNKLMKNLPIFRKTKFELKKGAYYHSLGYMYKVMYGNIPLISDIANFLLKSTPDKHVSLDILNEINPSHTMAFQKGTNNIIFDENTIYNELAMCFTGSLSKLRNLIAFYQTSYLTLEKAEDKKQRDIKTPRSRLSTSEIAQLEINISIGINKPWPKAYMLRKIMNYTEE